MRAMSNAFTKQLEIVDKDRWAHGPLELVLVPTDGAFMATEAGAALQLALLEWNQSYAAGRARDGETFDTVAARIKGIEHWANPNIILAPTTRTGVSELHIMLASLLPESALQDNGLERVRANMGLALFGRYDLPASYVTTVEEAFAKLMWLKIAPRRRFNPEFFSATSPLRLLAGDTRFWMNRIYRVALDRRETWFEPTTHIDREWESMQELQKKFNDSVPEDSRSEFDLRRPLRGGTIWDETDAAERDAVLEDVLTGAGVMQSLEPVIDLLQSQRAHEDFSNRASWIKEDFERTFYSKRAKLKVALVETVDDAPVWSSDECDGYGEVLFRDLLAALNVKERKLLVALRMGRTASDIAAADGLKGHASISRRISALKARIQALLG
jgi:hypothetical protein